MQMNHPNPTETPDSNSMTHWKEESKDPCIVPLREAMKKRLEGMLRTTTLDRIAFITEAVRGKRTLDIGCVENDADHYTREEWLHNHVLKSASACLGIDILEAEVESLKQKGYNVRFHDITKAPLEETFEVIVSGEIVEHIGNIDGLLSNCRRSLEPGGKLILSTPYPWFIGVSFRHTVSSMYFPGSLEHVTWYDPANFAELATRHGYVFESYAGIEPLPLRGSWKRNAFEAFAGSIRRGHIPFLTPLCGCRSILYILTVPA